MKVLIISTLGLRYDGITQVIYNYCSHINSSCFEMDFVAQPDVDKQLAEKFMGLGGLVSAPIKKYGIRNYMTALNQIFKNKKYNTVHIHGNSGTMLLEVVLAKLHGVKKMIVHCHNTSCNHPAVNALAKRPMIWMATHLLACSAEAGAWLYGNSKFTVLNNAIDISRFRFSQDTRHRVRLELGIQNSDVVIGHVGSFNDQKNHSFLIDAFSRVKQKRKEAKLLLLGDGANMDAVKAKAVSLGLDGDIIYAGRQSDPERFYQAMDLFAFPSKYEGLGMVLIEAQASGLPCIASTAVPDAANAAGKVVFEALDANQWAERILAMIDDSGDREMTSKHNISLISKAGFDIKTEAQKLEKFYRS